MTQRASPKVVADAVALLSCLAHPVRLAVVERLHREGPIPVGILCRELKVEQSAMSHHLALMRDARLVRGSREGRAVVYHLADGHVGRIVDDTLAHAAERAT